MSWINRDDLIEWLHTEEDEMLEIDDRREAHEASYIRKHVREMPGMDVSQVMQELKVLGALENADLAKTVKEYCEAQRDDCIGCKYHDIGRYKGCIFTCDDVAPEDWEI